jgi:hypothetical protein
VKLFAFLRRAAGLEHETFLARWRPLPIGRRATRYVQNHVLQEPGLPLVHTEFDCVDELWFESLESLTDALADLAGREVLPVSLEDVVDRPRSVLLACEEAVQFDRGFGKVKFIGLPRRHPSMTHDEWVRYWIEVHGPLAHEIPEFTRYYGRYVHNYAVPLDAPGFAPAGTYDGVVEEWVETAEDFARCLEEPRYLEVIRPDELRFVDFEHSHHLLAIEHRVSP